MHSRMLRAQKALTIKNNKQNVSQGTEHCCSVKHDSKLLSRNSLLLPPPTLPLPQKKNMKPVSAATLLGAA